MWMNLFTFTMTSVDEKANKMWIRFGMSVDEAPTSHFFPTWDFKVLLINWASFKFEYFDTIGINHSLNWLRSKCVKKRHKLNQTIMFFVTSSTSCLIKIQFSVNQIYWFICFCHVQFVSWCDFVTCKRRRLKTSDMNKTSLSFCFYVGLVNVHRNSVKSFRRH